MNESSDKEIIVTVPTPPDNPVSNYVVSLLRTWVPIAWGALLTWGASQLPALEPYLNSPGMLAVGAALAGVLAGAWYALWRAVEKRIPAWLTRFLLGANRTPKYVDGTVNSVSDRPLRGGFDDLPEETKTALREKYGPPNRL